MKKIVSVLLIVATVQFAFGQVTKKTLELPAFKSIYVNSNYTVLLKQTNRQEVVVEALTEIYDLTDIHVEDGILMINTEKKQENAGKSVWAKIDDIKVNPTMKVIVSMKQIDVLQVNGGGKIISQNSLATNNISLLVSGNGSIDVDLKGDDITADVSGSGKISMKGYGNAMRATISGSGSINSFNCVLETANVKVSGSGVCELNASNQLDVFISGSGVVRHKGNTKNVQKKVYGPGVVERAY